MERESWLTIMELPSTTAIPEAAYLCSSHFQARDFRFDLRRNHYELKSGVKPSIFDHTSHLNPDGTDRVAFRAHIRTLYVFNPETDFEEPVDSEERTFTFDSPWLQPQIRLVPLDPNTVELYTDPLEMDADLQIDSIPGQVRSMAELSEHYQNPPQTTSEPGQPRSIVISRKNADGSVTPVASKPIHEILSLADPIFQTIPPEQRRLIMAQFGVQDLPDLPPPDYDIPLTLSTKNANGSSSVVATKMLSQLQSLSDPFFQDLSLAERQRILSNLGVRVRDNQIIPFKPGSTNSQSGIPIPKGYSKEGHPVFGAVSQTRSSVGAANGVKKTKKKKMTKIMLKLRQTRSKLESDNSIIATLRRKIASMEREMATLRRKTSSTGENVVDREKRLTKAITDLNNTELITRKTQTRIRDFKAKTDADLEFSDDEHFSKKRDILPSLSWNSTSINGQRILTVGTGRSLRANGMKAEDLADFQIPSNIVVYDEPPPSANIKRPRRKLKARTGGKKRSTDVIATPANTTATNTANTSTTITSSATSPLKSEVVEASTEAIVHEMVSEVVEPPLPVAPTEMMQVLPAQVSETCSITTIPMGTPGHDIHVQATQVPVTYSMMIDAGNTVHTTVINAEVLTSMSGTGPDSIPYETITTIEIPSKPEDLEHAYGNQVETVIHTTEAGVVNSGKMQVMEETVDEMLSRDMPSAEELFHSMK
eukprot:TCALIF_12223-PA protein Name:"Protein of unknown function" AED:0.07 eAED:0.07 QI:0/-1/0/1/-1/1/1/0/707